MTSKSRTDLEEESLRTAVFSRSSGSMSFRRIQNKHFKNQDCFWEIGSNIYFYRAISCEFSVNYEDSKTTIEGIVKKFWNDWNFEMWILEKVFVSNWDVLSLLREKNFEVFFRRHQLISPITLIVLRTKHYLPWFKSKVSLNSPKVI